MSIGRKTLLIRLKCDTVLLLSLKVGAIVRGCDNKHILLSKVLIEVKIYLSKFLYGRLI